MMRFTRLVPLLAIVLLLLPMVISQGGSPPSPPVFLKMNTDGFLYVTNPESVLIVIGTDSYWISADYLNMDDNRIINLAAPVEDGDAVNKYYADNLAAGEGSTDSMKVDTGDGVRYNNVTKTLVLTEGVAIDIVANDDTTAYYLLSINVDTSYLNANWKIATAGQATKDGSGNTITSHYSPTTHNHDGSYIADGVDEVKNSHIDWGSGASQVDVDDLPESGTRKFCLPGDTANWNTAWTWGDHSGQNYLDDDVVDDVDDADIDWGSSAGQVDADDIPESDTRIWPTPTQETNWDVAYGWGNHASQTYLTESGGANPVADADVPDGITITGLEDSTNWNLAWSWGDHSTYDYLSDNLLSLFKYHDRTYFDTLIDASGDSIICIYADSTDIGKFDTDDLAQGSSNLYNQTHTGDVTGSVALSIASGAVGTAEIDNASILFEDIGQNSATTDQVMTWSGSAWTASDQATGLTLANLFGLCDRDYFDTTTAFAADSLIVIFAEAADSSGKALQDASGNVITTTYLLNSGDTLGWTFFDDTSVFGNGDIIIYPHLGYGQMIFRNGGQLILGGGSLLALAEMSYLMFDDQTFMSFTDGDGLTWRAADSTLMVQIDSLTLEYDNDTIQVDTSFMATVGSVALIGDDTTNWNTAWTWGDHSTFSNFVEETNWKMWYSNGSGDVTELGLGDNGKVLTATGSSTAPAWEIPASFDNPFFYGDFTFVGNMNQWGVGHQIDTAHAHANHADTNMWFPTFYSGWDADDSAECIGDSSLDHSHALHPSLLYIPEGYAGYRFWMAHTPICISESDENPHLAVSNDGQNWTDSIFSNPLFEPSDFNCLHLSDPDLFPDDAGGLWMVFRASWTGDTSALFVIGSADGVTWDVSDSVRITSSGIIDDGSSIHPLYSPAVILDTSGTYSMWVVEAHSVQPDAMTYLTRYTAPEPDDGWTLIDTCTFNNLPTDRKLWHIEVLPNGADELVALLTLCPLEENGDSASLHLAVSHDRGASWTADSVALLGETADSTAWDYDRIYRATGYWIDNSHGKEIGLYYSAYGANGWGTGYTKITFDAGVEPGDVDTMATAFTNYVDNHSYGGGDDTIIVVVPADFVHGYGTRPPGDSVWMSLEGAWSTGTEPEPYMAVDTSQNNDQSDTTTVSWSALPDGCISVDSVFFTYKTSNASYLISGISDIDFWVPDHTAGSVMADSAKDIYGGAPFASTSWALTSCEVDLVANAREQVALTIKVSIDLGEDVYIGRAYLTCKVVR